MYWDLVEKIVSSRGRQVQRYSFFEEVWRALKEGDELVVVRAATGCGKTEAITVPFFHGLLSGSRSWFSLVYALPSRALVSAMRKRIIKSLTSLGVTHATVTSNYGEPLALTPFLEGDVAVSTYDTLIYSFYGVRAPTYHVLLPLSKLAGSLVIFDEVQLVQDTHWFSMSLLPAHISNLLEFGARVVLMSATIPNVLLNEIEKEVRGIATPIDVVSKDRPLRGKLEIEIKNEPLPRDENMDGVVVDDIAECGKLPALIVTNTVEKAVSIYRRLVTLKREGKIGDAVPLLLHSRLSLGRRVSVEKLFEEEGERDRLSRAIVVATQVIEAGLDIDVKYLLTELSPIDSLIQRLGRTARKSDGEAVVFLDPDGGKGVYPGVLLERTLQVVKGNADALAESVSNLDAAQTLVDCVYTHDVIASLSKPKERVLIKVRELIHQFPQKLFSSSMREDLLGIPLLRLGYELPCLYVQGEDHEKLLKLIALTIGIDEVKSNIVRISWEDTRKLPKCIVQENNKIVAVKLSLQCRGIDSEEVVLEPSIVEPNNLHKVLERRDTLFLLNPKYYEVYEDLELGVVKPWGEA